MITKENSFDFIQYFRKRLLNLPTKTGLMFADDYKAHTGEHLTTEAAKSHAAILEEAFYSEDPVEELQVWADKHISPSARKRFLTAQRQKKSKEKSDLVTLQATKEAKSNLAYTVSKNPQLLGQANQAQIVELMTVIFESALFYSGEDVYEGKDEESRGAMGADLVGIIEIHIEEFKKKCVS